MNTIKQIKDLINLIPIGKEGGVSAKMLKDTFLALLNRELFSGSYTDLSNIPNSIEDSRSYKARIYHFENTEEELKQNATIFHSGAQIMAESESTMNVLIYPSKLGEGFETFIDQFGSGAVNFINAEPGDYSMALPAGKSPQTQSKLDTVSVLIWGNKIILKGDLKDA